MLYSKDLTENLRQRAILLSEANDNPEIQLKLMRMCEEDPLFFFNMFLWTYKPKAVGAEWEPESPNLPFITYSEFQDEYILSIIWHIENQEDNITEKSREMGFSWMILWVHVWAFLFKRWSSLIGSYKEDYVDEQWNMDSSFERIRYMMSRLPSWMKPKDMISKYMSVSSKSIWCEIAWDAGASFGTGWRRKFVFLDEFSLWQNDSTAFRKTADVTNCRIFWGTPEWRFNIYGRIMTNHKDYAHLSIKKHRLHWSKHPLKTIEWYEAQKKKRTKLDVAKELDISYDDSVEGAVYTDFTSLVRVKPLEYNPNLKTYTSWDFGRDSNALIFWQKDFWTNRLFIIHSVKRVNWHIEKFLAFVTGKPTQNHVYDKEDLNEIDFIDSMNLKYSWHFWDPYNGNAITTNATESIYDILARYGIHLTLKTGSTVESRIRDTTLALSRIVIDEQQYNLIQSMIQSRYPKVKEWSEATNEKTKPIHDENSHFRTAFEYFIDNEPHHDVSRITSEPRVFHNKITGKTQYTSPSQNRFWLAQR